MAMTMTWDEQIQLGNIVETIERGEPLQSIEWRTVFANKKSVKQSEFYQAANVGLKPELVFEVHTFEFDNDEKVKFEGKEYTIIRTYNKGKITELTVSAHVGVDV